MNATTALGSARSARSARPFFYVGIALLMIAIALAGFWPRYYGPLVNGTSLDARSSHILIHVHSTLFFGWLFMLMGQAMLVRSGRTGVHRSVGPWLAFYGFGVGGVGIVTGIVLSARRAEARDVDAGAAFLFVTLTDMLIFLGFLAAAVVKRRKIEAHKRLMVLATWSLAIVGFSRLLTRIPGFADERWWLGTLLFPLPALIGIAYDWRTRGRVHPIWFVGVAVFVIWANRGLYANSEGWLPIGRALLQPLPN